MDMKSYILVGGGLLICLVLFHALVSAWLAKRRASNIDSEPVPDPLDGEAEIHAAIPWPGEEAPESSDPLLGDGEETEQDRRAPVLMDRLTAGAETDDAAVAVEESGDVHIEAMDALQDHATFDAETPEATQGTQDGAGTSRKGRRIDIRGKRTEPTVPRTSRSGFRQFAPPERLEPTADANGAAVLDDLIVIWLFAKRGRLLDGGMLLKLLVAHGLKCDATLVFKKRDPRCGGEWYTVANGLEPGTFDISRPAALETPGIAMLLAVGQVRDPGAAFEDMLDVAQDIAIKLDGELKDERTSDMTVQTIEHCRQRIRDIRRMRIRA